MNNRLKLFCICLVVLISNFIITGVAFSSSSSCLNYQRDKAVFYAQKYWNKRNSNYNAYKYDCTNFVSQALVAGGLTESFDPRMCKGPGVPCWDWNAPGAILDCEGCVDDKGMVIRPNPFPAILANYFCAELSTTFPSNLKKGDVIVMGGSSLNPREHSAIVVETGGTFETTYVATHSNDHEHQPLTYFKEHGFNKFTYIHFPYDDDDKKCKCFEKDPETLLCKQKEEKCNKCETCNPDTGECEPKRCNGSSGRCRPKQSCDTETGQCQTSQGGDCPDETFTVGTGIIEESVPPTSSYAGVGVLNHGFAYDMVGLLASFNVTARVLNLADLSPALVDEMPLLIIPSAGLYGMENSEILKTVLQEYVKEGGTILVLSQQHGYEYSVLPTPDGKPLSGYGWVEDQSCFYRSAFIDTWHPVLAGLTESTPNISIDGYFTQYPEDSTVLLRRTSNGQPVLLMYPYGKGYVVATTAYPDTAYTRKESSEAERRLIRDIVAWAERPETLTEVRPGEQVNLIIPVTNPPENIINATNARIKIYDPERKIVSEKSVPIDLPPGDSTTVQISFITEPNSMKGIWHTSYELTGEGIWNFDDDDDPNTFQVVNWLLKNTTEEPSGRFLVSNPPKNPYKSPDFNFSIQSDKEYYSYGSTATFTIIGWNNTDTDHTITVRYHYGWTIEGVHTFKVPANSSAFFHIVVPNVYSRGWFWATFYDETGESVGYARKGIRVFQPNVNVSVETDKEYYTKGKDETVTISISIKNNISYQYPVDIKTTIIDPSGTKLFEETQSAELSANGTILIKSNYTISSTIQTGTYVIVINLFSGTYMISGGHGTFDVLDSQIKVTPILPGSFTAGTNTVSFSLENTGLIDVNSGQLQITFKDPDGVVLYEGSHGFSLPAGQSTTIDIPLTIPSLKFGKYILTYSQSDETRQGSSVTTPIINMVTIRPGLDRFFYKVRETATLTVDITNTGIFDIGDATLTVSVPDAGYSDTRDISIQKGQATELTFAIPIAETLTAGSHDVDITMALASGSTIGYRTGFWVPRSRLLIRYTGSETLKAGDTVTMDVENTGGVDTGLIYKVSLFNSSSTVYRESINDTILVGQSKTYSFQIPPQAVNGEYILQVDMKDTTTGKVAYLRKTLSISGLNAGLGVRTDRDVYFTQEAITALSSIVNGTYPIDGGLLHLQIVNKCARVWIPASYHISTWDGTEWVERGVLHYPDSFETQVLDLSDYLPDASGQYRIRIRHQGTDNAEIDYLALMVDGTVYEPASATNLDTGEDILYYLKAGDSLAANVLNNEIEVSWTGLPSDATNKVLLLSAREGTVEDTACQERIYWQTDIPINQAANTTEQLSTAAGSISETGQFYLQGRLLSKTGQVIGTSEYPFNVVDGDIALGLHTDRDVYRPGETVTVTGNVINLGPLDRTSLTVQVRDENFNTLYSETFDLPASGTHQFSFTVPVASEAAEGIHQLYGEVYQSEGLLTSSKTIFEVYQPSLTASVDAPEVVGHEPFEINLRIDNPGRVAATVEISAAGGSLSDNRSITLEPGQSRLIQYSDTINTDTTYTITITGDLNQTFTLPVTYGEGVRIEPSVEQVYPEGQTRLPVRITNTGQMDETVEVRYQLMEGNTLLQEQTKTYALAAGATTEDTLLFDLKQGSYTLRARSSLPEATAEVAFEVRKKDDVVMAVAAGTQTEGLIPVTVELTNRGYNGISGSIHLTVLDGQGSDVWAGVQDITLPFSLTPAAETVQFSFNPSAVKPGDYTLKAELLDDANRVIATESQPLSIQGAAFEIVQLPGYQSFQAGGEAELTFVVKNTGNQEGQVSLTLKSYDFVEQTETLYLGPQEQRAVTFRFVLPEDIETKDYYADYRLQSGVRSQKSGVIEEGTVRYHVEGVSITVNATLDKAYYSEGDTAQLTIEVTSQAPGVRSLLARVHYGDYEQEQAFELSGTQTLTFDIPLPEITGEKLFYGIYHETGRSIYLNSLYIYRAGDLITVTTDKQVYAPGETVTVQISAQDSGLTGQMTLRGPGGYTETFLFSGRVTRSFTLPAEMTAGTYTISAELQSQDGQSITETHPIDVAGIEVKIKEATLDRASYNPTDTMQLSLRIESNTAMAATVKAWVVDPENVIKESGTEAVMLSAEGPVLFKGVFPLESTVAGIHRLLYGIYDGEKLLVSGSEAFDVGRGVVLGLSTDRHDYPEGTEPVKARVSLWGHGEFVLELLLDGTVIQSSTVALDGFKDIEIDLGTQSPGVHKLLAVLKDGSLTSRRETSFSYGTSLPDLMGTIDVRVGGIRNDTLPVKVVVKNYGRTESTPSEVALYVAGQLVATQPIAPIKPGEVQEVEFTYDLKGYSGQLVLKAVIDPEDAVKEFNEENNEATTTVDIPEERPDFTVSVDNNYQSVKQAETARYRLQIGAISGYDSEVALDIDEVPEGTTVTFSPATLVPPGEAVTMFITTEATEPATYEMTIRATSDGIVHTAEITLDVRGFSLEAEPSEITLKQGEQTEATITLKAENGYTGTVQLSVESPVDGLEAIMGDTNLNVPSDTGLTIKASEDLPPGEYEIEIKATDGLVTKSEEIHVTVQEAVSYKPVYLATPGPGVKNRAIVRLIDTDLNLLLELEAFPYRYGANAAMADIDGDGLREIVVTPGPDPKAGGIVRVFDQQGRLIHEQEIFSTKRGMGIAAGDFDGDGTEEVVFVEGSGLAGHPTIAVMKYTPVGFVSTGLEFSYHREDRYRQHGRSHCRDDKGHDEHGHYGKRVVVATADTDGDGSVELLVLSPAGHQRQKITVYRINTDTQGRWYVEEEILEMKLHRYNASSVAGCDIDGDGAEEVVVGGREIGIFEADGSTVSLFEPFNRQNKGVYTGCLDTDGDTSEEIIAGKGPEPKNRADIRVFRPEGTLIKEFRALPDRFRWGVKVGGGMIVERK
ncbi:MAG TPA: hypothetical protein ENK09_01205 [Nitrospirae bacterium]|nr:hypothetical protein [Nitrospirota bacterium]